MTSSKKQAMINIIASNDNWIEGEAIRQLEYTANLQGMKKAIGMPDLHPGKGYPIGGAFFSEKIFYPYLIGNDIGCGMAMWQTNLKRHKAKLDRWIKKIPDLQNKWQNDSKQWLLEEGLDSSKWDSALGTLGGGNHFAELQEIHSIEDREEFGKLGLSKNNLFLLVHSGSRGLGEEILRTHVDQYKNNGLQENSESAAQYLKQHDYAIKWACLNRALIAHRFLCSIGAKYQFVLDLPHNTIKRVQINDSLGWLHRKGAVSSNSGTVVIPGSRGSFTYLVSPIGDQKNNCFSLAHGAGRKWKRSDSKSRLKRKYNYESLLKTELGSKVICNDKNLLYEEAPQNYKNISVVINDLKNAGLISVLAILKPLLTYKTRRR